MRALVLFMFLVLGLVFHGGVLAEEYPISEATQFCLECHTMATPAIVADWKRSRHSVVTPAQALKADRQARKVSSENVPDELAGSVVGCAECHTQEPDTHPDSFEHEGYQVHVVVTPRDCSACHQVENEQFQKNKMAWAHINLTRNPLYHDLIGSINGLFKFETGKLMRQSPDAKTNAASCLACHGTRIEVKGAGKRVTDFGDYEFPILDGWPNQGVGRINPDSSMGACTACHTRHQFSIKMARQPYTCSQCHKGPDVPAYKVYGVSKHGNIFSSLKDEWDFSTVPWTIGRDMTAPTCAVCHMSLLVDGQGNVLAERTHQVNDRLPWRLFGLVYAHPQPESPDTTKIRNKGGLPLPTELTGEPQFEYLIGPEEQKRRTAVMQKVCLGCHTLEWVNGQWDLLEHTIQTTNEMTRTATDILLRAWATGAAKGPGDGNSVFDEVIERKWVEQWLFYANSARLSAAMNGADYGVFDGGRWDLTLNLQEMYDWLSFKQEQNKNTQP